MGVRFRRQIRTKDGDEARKNKVVGLTVPVEETKNGLTDGKWSSDIVLNEI